jgi:hypothetical protein
VAALPVEHRVQHPEARQAAHLPAAVAASRSSRQIYSEYDARFHQEPGVWL